MRQCGSYFGGGVDDVTRLKIQGTLAHIARQADPSGEFFRATADIRRLRDKEFLEKLRERNYECLVAVDNGQIVGLLGYQRHDGSDKEAGWHLFAWNSFIENQGIATQLEKLFLEMLWKEAPVKRARLSAGDRAFALEAGNAGKAKRLLEKAVNDELNLPFLVRPYGEKYGWIELIERETAVAVA